MWQTALSELELQMTKATFSTWVRPMVLLSWMPEVKGSERAETHVVIGTPNGYVKDWLENRLITPIQRTLKGIAQQPVVVRFEICEQPQVRQSPLLESGG